MKNAKIAALLFVVQILPWLVIVVPAVWASWKGMRRLLNWRRKAPPAPEK